MCELRYEKCIMLNVFVYLEENIAEKLKNTLPLLFRIPLPFDVFFWMSTHTLYVKLIVVLFFFRGC